MSFRTISVRLTGNASSLNSALYQASRSINNFGLGMTRSGAGSLLKFGAAATLAGSAAIALTRAFTASVRQAVAFDAAMRNVNSISGLSESQLHGLGQSVLDLSTRVPQSATTLANGLYQIASSGFQGAEGLTILKASAVAATAGLTDTATSAQVIVGALNAYGLGADQATKVSDELFQTVNVGVLTFNDLAQGMGEVTASAAAAHVPLADVGAAIATMTRAGLVPAEAFTALNRVIVSILQPSDALATLFKQLGYQSGAAALQTRGLHGVIEDIRVATGGSATAMGQLFTDIRGFKGALDLMSNSGRLYNDVSQQFTDQTQIQGRTLKTFQEQMKSVSAQWSLFKNRVSAVAIEAATHLLPAILQLLDSITALGHAAGGVFHDLGPFFTALRNVGADVLTVFREMLAVATPLAKAIAGLVGGAVIATLNEFGRAVQSVTGFLAKHKEIVAALAALYIARLLPALAASAWTALGTAIATVTSALGGGISNLRQFATSMDAATVAQLGFKLALAGVAFLAVRSYQKEAAAARDAQTAAEQHAKALVGQRTNAVSSLNLLDAALRRVNEAQANFKPPSDEGWYQQALAVGANTAALKEQQEALTNTRQNAGSLAAQLGVTTDAVLHYASQNNIDLSQPWVDEGDAVKQITEGLTDLAKKAGTTLPQLEKMAGGDVEAWQALADAISKAGDAAKAAFAGANDVIQQFDPASAAETVKNAQDQLVAAQKRLKDETAQYNAQKDKSVSSDQQLRDARQGVADATKNLRDAQSEAAKTGDLSTIYRNDIRQSQRFVTQIQDAIKRGLDPQFVARLLQAGPEQAGPILDQIVSDHSGRLIKLANTSETTLAKISAQAVRIAQFTAHAINAPLDEQERLAGELPKAIALQEALFANPKIGGDALAKKLRLSPSQLEQIAHDFGITLPRTVQSELDKHPVTLRVRTESGDITYTTTPDGRVHFAGSKATAVATGGYITGPGTTTSDSIPAWLSNKEYVQPAKAVDYYGVPFMEAIRRLQLPRYASGGYVTPTRRFADGGRVAGSSTPTIVRVIEQPATYVTRNETNVGEVRPYDSREFLGWLAQERRRKALRP